MGLTRPTAAQINSNVEVITDPLSVLNNRGTNNNQDVGLIMNRNGGGVSNVALFWQESSQSIVYALTSSNGSVNSNVTVTSYANVVSGFANIYISSGSVDSALQIVGNVARGGSSYHDFLRVTSTASGATTPNKYFRLNGSGTLQIIDSNYGNTIMSLTDSGILADKKGDVRTAPQNSQSGAYVLVATDAGKHISITTGGVTVNANIFSAGDMVTIYNNSGSSQNITQGTSVTLRLAGTATTGNRALAQYGVSTLLCVTGGASPVFACTGAGLT
jgi:hypothetical protein